MQVTGAVGLTTACQNSSSLINMQNMHPFSNIEVAGSIFGVGILLFGTLCCLALFGSD